MWNKTLLTLYTKSKISVIPKCVHALKEIHLLYSKGSSNPHFSWNETIWSTSNSFSWSLFHCSCYSNKTRQLWFCFDWILSLSDWTPHQCHSDSWVCACCRFRFMAHIGKSLFSHIQSHFNGLSLLLERSIYACMNQHPLHFTNPNGDACWGWIQQDE